MNGKGKKKLAGKIKAAASPCIYPIRGLLRSTRRRFRSSELAAAKTFYVGVPFYDVSFRAFTASPTIEKGTPTDQQFDNRSIA